MINSEVGNKKETRTYNINLNLNGILYSDQKIVSEIFCDEFSNKFYVCNMNSDVNNYKMVQKWHGRLFSTKV